jgi:hypothetical protein
MAAHIDSASFGSLVVDGKTYRTDLIISPEGRVEEGWRRGRGHRLTMDDIRGLVEACPEVIVAGTGITGMMRPDSKLEKELQDVGIEFFYARNKKALKLFNDLAPSRRTGACFHLTC